MAQLCSDPHAQFAEHPLAPAVVKASGSNYLAQSLHEGASALAIPTSRGNVCLHRWSAGGLPSDALSVIDAAPEAASRNAAVAALAWCPADPELLALALYGERLVQVWRLHRSSALASRAGM